METSNKTNNNSKKTQHKPVTDYCNELPLLSAAEIEAPNGFRVVSFFAGCGGLDLGFEQAGFKVVWANDFEKAVKDTYQRNHPNSEFVLGDMTKIKPEELPDCDGFIGGPPCQSWSVAGKQRGLEDKRGQLFLTYIEMIKQKKPKFFLIENVKGLLDQKFKEVFSDFLIRLSSAGYNIQWQLLDAVNYRIPQNRERVFIVGFRKDLKVSFTFPSPTCVEPVTLSMAIGDIIEEPRRFYKGKITSLNQERANHDVYSGPYDSYYIRGNRRRPWNRPSFTIHATGYGEPLHPSSPKMIYRGVDNWGFLPGREDEYRRLSIRECARIQSFPDSFIFEGTDVLALYRMIGNAVPPRLGYVLAKSILVALNHGTIETIPEVNNKDSFNLNSITLVGYYKNEEHLDLIKQNRLYYVRSDGRKGSLFKEDCSTIPAYLFLHHQDNTHLYKLDQEDPLLVDSNYLNSIGFKATGDKYLCFKLTNTDEILVENLIPKNSKIKYNKGNYSPYFTTMVEML